MDDKKQYYRLGLFVVISLVLLFCVLFVLGARSLFQPSMTFETYFNDSVAGLDVGAPVRFRGVTLGQVSAILTSPSLYEEDVPVDKRKAYIVVRATITGARTKLWRKELDAYIKRGLRVRTQLAGITGQQYLTIDFLDPKTNPQLPFEWQPEYAYVPSAPSLASELITGIQNLVSSLDKADIQQLGQNLNTLVLTANRKLEELPVAQLSADAAGLLKDARATVDRVDRVIAQSPIEQTLRNLASASARVDKVLADPGIQQTVDNAAAISARLRKNVENGEIDRIAKNLDRAVQRADALLADNQYDIRGVVQDLRVIAANLRTVSETVKRYPPGLLVGGPPEKVQVPNNPKKESK